MQDLEWLWSVKFQKAGKEKAPELFPELCKLSNKNKGFAKYSLLSLWKITSVLFFESIDNSKINPMLLLIVILLADKKGLIVWIMVPFFIISKSVHMLNRIIFNKICEVFKVHVISSLSAFFFNKMIYFKYILFVSNWKSEIRKYEDKRCKKLSSSKLLWSSKSEFRNNTIRILLFNTQNPFA